MIARPVLARALRALCLPLLGLALLQASAAAEPVKVRVSTIPIADTAAFEVARAKGFFVDEGLEVDTTPTAGGAAGIPALVSGQLQFAFSNVVSILLASSQGLDLTMIAAVNTTGDAPPDLAGIVAKPGAGFKDGRSLEGRRIAVNSRNNIIWLYAREWVRVTGGDPNKVTYVEVPFPQMTDSIQQDRVDAAMLVEPFLSAGLKGGQLESVGWPYSTVQKRIPVAQFVATKVYAQANPEIVAKFRRGLDKAVEWANANLESDEFLRIVSGFTKTPAERIKAATMPVFVSSIDPAGVDAVVALMKRQGLLKGDVDVPGLISPSIIGKN